jgi:hypothetical protein
LNGASSIQVVNGIANFSGLSIQSNDANDAGTYNLVFDAINSNLPGFDFEEIDFAQTITANGLTGTRLLFQSQPQNSSVNQAIPDFQVRIVDNGGFLCFTCDDNVTVHFHFGAGAMVGSATRAAVGGVATFSALVLRPRAPSSFG